MMHSHTNTSGCLEALINKTTVRSLLRLRPQNVHILLVLLLGLWARVGQAQRCSHGTKVWNCPNYPRECDAQNGNGRQSPRDPRARYQPNSPRQQRQQSYNDPRPRSGSNLESNVKCSHGNNLATCRQKIDKGPGHMLGEPCRDYNQRNMIKHFQIACQKCGLCNTSCEYPSHHGSDGNHQYHCKCGGSNGQSQYGSGYNMSTTEATETWGEPQVVAPPSLDFNDYQFPRSSYGGTVPLYESYFTGEPEAYSRSQGMPSGIPAGYRENLICRLCHERQGNKGKYSSTQNTADKCSVGRGGRGSKKHDHDYRGGHKRKSAPEATPAPEQKSWLGGWFGRRLAEDDVTLRRLAENDVNPLTAFCAWALMLLIVVVVYTLTKMGKRSAMQRRNLSKTQVAF